MEEMEPLLSVDELHQFMEEVQRNNLQDITETVSQAKDLALEKIEMDKQVEKELKKKKTKEKKASEKK